MSLRRWTFAPLLAIASLAVARPADADDRHVVVITIDGLPNYYLDDPQASLPALRGLISRGVVARQGMTVSNPSVTWPNHTTMMTGMAPEGHGVIYNGVIERHGPGKLVTTDAQRSQADLARVPLLFDYLKEAGLTSAAIFWPCTRDSASIDDNMPDVKDELNYTTPRLLDELRKAGLVQGFDAFGGAGRDEVRTEATCLIIRDRMPALLALHLVNLDSVHHKYGPKTPAGYAAAALADSMVRRILQAIDEAGHARDTTVFIVSDHGFITADHSVRPNIALRQAGLLTVDDKGDVQTARAHVIPEGGIGLVYLTDPATATEDAATVRRLFEGAEGVASVVGPDDYPRYRLPKPASTPYMADLVIACKEGYAIGGAAIGDDVVVTQAPAGVHGYLSTEPKMRAVFIAAGAGIRADASLDAADNVDLGPTVARLLGVRLPDATGKPIDAILEPGR